jgi:hypothetical protein
MIACRLTDPEFRERERTLLARFKSEFLAVNELIDGYAVRVPGDQDSLRLVSDLMAAERNCCPFLRFELIAEPEMGPITLSMTGPSGTKEFLKTILL